MSHVTQPPQRTTAERFLALSQVGTALMSELDEERLLHLIARTACELTGATFAAFSLRPIDEEGKPLVPAEGSLFHLAAVVGVTAEQEALFRHMPLGGEGLLAPIFRYGVPVLVADALAHLPLVSPLSASHLPNAKVEAREAAVAYAQGQLPFHELRSLGVPRGHPVVRSFLGAPLLDRAGEVRGGLLLGHADPDRFTEEDKAILVILAGQAAVALENARLYRLSQRQAAELQAMFDSIADGVTLVDRQGAIRRENAAARQLRQTLLDRPEAEQILEDWVHEPAQRLLEGEEVPEQLVQVMDADGERRDYLVRAQPLRPVMTPSGPFSQGINRGSPAAEQPLSGALVIWHDVTERRLRESERVAQAHAAQLEAVFQAMTDAVFVYDRVGNLVQINAAARAFFAFHGLADAASRPLEERQKRFFLYDKSNQLLANEDWPVRRILKGEVLVGAKTLEGRVQAREGQEVEASIGGAPLRDQEGHITGAVLILRDTGERQRLERHLAAAEQEAQRRASHLEAIFEAMTDGIYVYDQQGRIVQMNAAARALLARVERPDTAGLPLQERQAGASVTDAAGNLLAPGQWPIVRFLRGEQLIPKQAVELRMPRRDGQVQYTSTTGGPIRGNEGQIIGAVAIARDITEQKLAERKREQQAQQLRAQMNLIELAHDAILVRDPQSRIIFWNRGAQDLYGWMAQEAQGQLTHALLQTRFPVSPEAVDQFLEQEGQWEGELVHTTRDGRQITVESRQVLMLDAAGRPSAILEINRDITERQHLEQLEREVHAQMKARLTLLQLILDELPSCIYLARGPEARLVLANRAATTLFGAPWAPDQPLREFLSQHGIRILRPDGRPLEPEQIPALRVVQRGETVRQHQQVIRHADGTSLPVLVNAVPLDSAQLPGGTEQATANLDEPERATLVVYQDVTALKEAEALKDEFLSIATHELRAPLAVLKGYAQMLLRQASRGRGVPLTEWQQEGLQGINQAVTRLADLTEDLLDVTRLQAEQPSLSSEPTDLVALAERVVKRQQVITQRHHLTFQTVHAHLLVNIDPGRLEQVLSNLLSNAIKYSPQGGPIEVTLGAEEEAEEAVLCVRDHGMGIPAEQHARIFGRFVRADNARTSGIVGTGLGLYLCRELLERYGGRIWFESTEAVGSTFFVALPVIPKALL